MFFSPPSVNWAWAVWQWLSYNNAKQATKSITSGHHDNTTVEIHFIHQAAALFSLLNEMHLWTRRHSYKCQEYKTRFNILLYYFSQLNICVNNTDNYSFDHYILSLGTVLRTEEREFNQPHVLLKSSLGLEQSHWSESSCHFWVILLRREERDKVSIKDSIHHILSALKRYYIMSSGNVLYKKKRSPVQKNTKLFSLQITCSQFCAVPAHGCLLWLQR